MVWSLSFPETLGFLLKTFMAAGSDSFHRLRQKPHDGLLGEYMEEDDQIIIM